MSFWQPSGCGWWLWFQALEKKLLRSYLAQKGKQNQKRGTFKLQSNCCLHCLCKEPANCPSALFCLSSFLLALLIWDQNSLNYHRQHPEHLKSQLKFLWRNNFSNLLYMPLLSPWEQRLLLWKILLFTEENNNNHVRLLGGQHI